mgnify:CR=1 FL=1
MSKIENKLVAKYNEGDWFLEHWWNIDDFGMKRNSMQIYKIGDDGMKMIYPFYAPLRVRKFDKETALDGDDISSYETFEYAEMLREQVGKLSIKK